MPESKMIESEAQRLYQRYGPMILRRCRLLLRDEEMAKDAMQEVFVKLLKRPELLNARFPSALLYRIATNHCLSVLRAQRHRQTAGGDNLLNNIAAYDESEKRAVFAAILEKLFKKEEPSTREIAVMLFIDNMTLKEVACETGLSVSGVRRRIRDFRARVRIRGEMYHET